MRKTFRTGDLVTVGNAKRIPVRYQGRQAVVIGKVTGKKQYFVDFGPRRATPLQVPATQLSLA